MQGGAGKGGEVVRLNDDLESFVRSRTKVSSVPLCPELRLGVASDVTSLWEAVERLLGKEGLPPPFWAFCWPGGQALARFLLDEPERVAGLRVLDFGAGCGVAAIAAARAEASSVTASEVDPLAIAAMRMNFDLNGVSVRTRLDDLVGTDPCWDVVMAGDLCYERRVAEPLYAWLADLARKGVTVLLADPGRAYLPSSGVRPLATFTVPTSLDLEDAEQRETTIYGVDDARAKCAGAAEPRR